jgi:hypothetical protein
MYNDPKLDTIYVAGCQLLNEDPCIMELSIEYL